MIGMHACTHARTHRVNIPHDSSVKDGEALLPRVVCDQEPATGFEALDERSECSRLVLDMLKGVAADDSVEAVSSEGIVGDVTNIEVQAL